MSKSGPPKAASGVILHHAELIPELPGLQILTAWIQRVLRQEGRKMNRVYFVFLDDAALLKINQTHLQHDTYTDIITFPYCDNPIEAEIYISTERVRANAKEYRVPFQDEILRVMIHGILHLCGWRDKTSSQSQLMRNRENACLILLGIDPYSSSGLSPV